MQHTNFYETLAEAHMRLRQTVILYDGEPYVVLAITNHADGIFRIYLLPTGEAYDKFPHHTSPHSQFDPAYSALGQQMDAFMEANPKSGLIRKMMNSPKFNKFRPFPLGMVNEGLRTYYCERGPARPSTCQGLNGNMIEETSLTLTKPLPGSRGGRNVGLYGKALRACIMNDYPSAQTCLKELADPQVDNEMAAFHREFAFIKGPINIMFLVYRGDVIGVLPNNDLSSVRLGRDFQHCREVVQKLGLFSTIN